jgi:hypothetical protein
MATTETLVTPVGAVHEYVPGVINSTWPLVKSPVITPLPKRTPDPKVIGMY